MNARNLGESLRQVLCVFVIRGEELRPVFQGDQPRRREDAHLAHAAAEHLANDTAAFDKFVGAHNHRTHRRP